MDFTGAIGAFKAKPTQVKTEVDLVSIMKVFRPCVVARVHNMKQSLDTLRRETSHNATNEYQLRQQKESLRKLHGLEKEFEVMKTRWGGTGLDRYLSGLSSMGDYVKIWGDPHPLVSFPIPDVPYILAVTTTVIMRNPRYWERGFREPVDATFDMGQYCVMIPLGGSQGDIHWVPLRDPKTINRHPHHVYRTEEREAGTCWGNYRPYIAKLVTELEILPLLRLCGKFVHDYNPNSELRSLSNIQHKRRLP